MTLHAAKGLEFPVVFIAGMEKGLFPLYRAELVKDEEEEERRLFYVGITRAREKLFLSKASRRLRYGEYVSQDPSPFLEEIDPACLKGSFAWEEKTKRTERKFRERASDIPAPKASPPKWSAAARKKEISLKRGDLVEHEVFGVGKVLYADADSSLAKAVVQFQTVGKKVLALNYAKLKKL